MMRIFSLLLSVALSVGCRGTVVAQHVETQPFASAKEQTPAVATGGQPKEVVNSIGIKLLLMSAGTFTMGSPDSEKDRDDDETQHEVTLSKPFYMGRTEVTQGQWKKVMGTEPWKGKSLVEEGDDYPAVYISWDDAVAFCKKLSDKEGKTYRLPTEAEWEYACRGGTKTAFNFGDDEADLGKYAWFDGNAWDIHEKYAHRVAQKRPNPFGLHDMHGNVWEWCSDWYFADFRLTSWKVCWSLAITARLSPMSNQRKRVNYSGEEKVAILRAHFVEGLPVSEICLKYDISVTNFYNWQKILFEGAAQLFDRKPNASNVRRQEAAAEKKVEALEATDMDDDGRQRRRRQSWNSLQRSASSRCAASMWQGVAQR